MNNNLFGNFGKNADKCVGDYNPCKIKVSVNCADTRVGVYKLYATRVCAQKCNNADRGYTPLFRGGVGYVGENTFFI
ncbi:hypothetical protein A9308_00670 [Moraxella atlantae]|uniref:Uncharacterized protein n=1 Tax=Faucicola atlantae TaxID=34059 RepID=A0A1B8Q923_9GAMM|nr:hypothetical protein A9308_00670 [Moraxella atlantae]